MRYKGYVVTYAGDLQKVNRENYFLNGICREEFDGPNFYEENKDFRSRNLYAVSSGVKCDEAGGELALIATDLLHGFFNVDFSKESRRFFNLANSAITSHVLEKKEEHFEIDLSVLYIDNDVATVFNIGDMPVFFFEKGHMKKLTGKPPAVVEVEKNTFDNAGQVQTQMLVKQNIPRLGFLSEECEAAPFVSEKVRLRGKTFFVLCSKAVSDVIGEKQIEEILNNENIKGKDKASRIIDAAIEANPDGNYTVQVVESGRGLAVTVADMRSIGVWIGIALLCGAFYLGSPYIIGAINTVVETCRAVLPGFSEDDTEHSGLKWTPTEQEEDETDEKSEEAEEAKSPETEKGDEEKNEEPKQNTATAPSKQPTPSKKPSASTQTTAPSTQSQRPQTQSQAPTQEPEPQGPDAVVPEPEPEIEEKENVNPAPPKVNTDVELPIDFN